MGDEPTHHAFLERHREADTPYVAAVRAGLRVGTMVATSSGVGSAPCAELVHTYRHRAQHLLSIQTEHAAHLQREVLAFCQALENAIDDSCRLYSFRADDGSTYDFFEAVGRGDLLGALRSWNARIISDEKYLEVWGRARPPFPGA
jgi:hypothetical protein